MSLRVLPPFLAALTLWACDPVPVVPTADRRQNTETSRIEGNLVVSGPARGNVVLSLFDAARPPPPAGTGRPLAFAFVPGAALFDGASPGFAGPFTAPFSFSLVPPGRYLISGYLDADGCQPTATAGCRGPDFNPWASVTAEPNKGDVGGAALADTATRTPRVLEVSAEQPTVGVSVTFAPTATVPFDRPAFTFATPLVLDPAAGTKVVELVSSPLQQGPVDERQSAFIVRYVDDNGDGSPDDANGDGIGDLWPKVVVRKLAEGTNLDENDLDRNGVLDAEGASYVHQDPARDGKPAAVVLAAGWVPDEPLAALSASGGAPVPMTRLKLAVRPIAIDVADPTKPAPLAAVPPGRYAVTVIQFTGQTWRLPNELDPAVAGAFGLEGLASQSVTIEVP